jgi:deoxyribodipyrimidine photo-lyase
MKYSLVWFRNDLRVDDHEALTKASRSGYPVLGLYCFDPRQYEKTSFGFPKTGPHRASFIKECVLDLKDQMNSLGFPFIAREGKPEELIFELSSFIEIKEIHFHKELGQEEEDVENLVKSKCKNINFHLYYGHNLIHPDDCPFSLKNTPDVFTTFRKMVEKNLTIRQTYPVPKQSQSIDVKDIEGFLQEPDLGISKKRIQNILKGGSKEGQKRLHHYFYEADRLKIYKQTRNGMLDFDDSSKLSPYLSQGCLSPRTIYYKIKEYEKLKIANDSTYWLIFELLWRDYFWLVHMKFKNKIFHLGGLFNLNFPWSNNEKYIRAWLDGKTGYPLVDANMLELKTTGYMSNRGRQNVASFLTKNLGIDWRIGAQWFESCLLDYDVSSNYGNWCYVAGVGNDARTYRYFNVTKQGKEYDPDGRYAKKWLPSLEKIPSNRVYDIPHFTWIEQAGYQLILGENYPVPLVALLDSSNTQKVKYEKAMKDR